MNISLSITLLKTIPLSNTLFVDLWDHRRVQGAEKVFLRRVAGISLRDWVRSSLMLEVLYCLRNASCVEDELIT